MHIKHTFVSSIPDDPAAVAAGQVAPSNWNDDHVLTPAGDIRITGTTGTMLTSDDIFEINVTTAFTAHLPIIPINFKEYLIIDGSGNASTHNITVQPIGYVIGSDSGSWRGYYNGSIWRQTG